MRETVKVRMVAGSLVVSLPQSVLDPVGIREGDRVIVEAAPPRRLVITKEGKTMTSTQHLEMEVDLLEKKRTVIESDLTYKQFQHNSNMPCEEDMKDSDVALLTMSYLAREQARLDLEIAEKRMQLYEAQGGDTTGAQPSPTGDGVRHSRPSKVERGWYYRVDREGQDYFLAFVNAKGSCSVRHFDANNGATLRRPEKRKGSYRDSFTEYLEGAVPLHLSRQPNLDRDCKDRLPPSALKELQGQVKLKS